MMKISDPARSCPNPRLIAAIYFGLLSVVGTILTNALLTSLGIQEKIPLFEAIILGMVIASCTGALMGERLIHCARPYKLKAFFIGFMMVIASLPFFVLGLVYFMKQEHSDLFTLAQTHNMLNFYLYVLAYSYILYGIALALGSGIAALYLRGQLVYDILATYESKTEIEELPDSPVEKNKVQHSDRVSIKHQ